MLNVGYQVIISIVLLNIKYTTRFAMFVKKYLIQLQCMIVKNTLIKFRLKNLKGPKIVYTYYPLTNKSVPTYFNF